MKRPIFAGIMLVMLLVMMGTFAGGAGSEPFSWITASGLKSLMDRNEPTLAIVDSRSNGEYQEAHIRTAVNIPLSVQEQNSQALRFAKNARLVFYCNGFS